MAKDTIRTNFYFDGYNLYHAIHGLKEPHLKWLDLRSLAEVFAPKSDYTIKKVYYFTALAKWLPESKIRHNTYIRALEARDVTVVKGMFKKKDEQCRTCGSKWKRHEEKETDVHIGIQLLSDAYEDKFDTAFVVSADSDFSCAVRMVKSKFPEKVVKLITPPNRKPSYELRNAVGGKKFHKPIKKVHLEKCRLPDNLSDAKGFIVVPQEYQ